MIEKYKNNSIHQTHPTQGNKVFVAGPDLKAMELVHSDDRRTIREVVIPQVGGGVVRAASISVKEASADQPIVLGNHYHDVPEHFAVFSGEPEIKTQMVDGLADEVDRTTVPDDTFVTMKPNQAHTFTFEKPGELKTTVLANFEDTGLHPHKLA